MRYILICFRNKPPANLPYKADDTPRSGEDGVIRIGDFLGVDHAMFYIRPTREKARLLKEEGFKHMALYTFPRSLNLSPELVHKELL